MKLKSSILTSIFCVVLMQLIDAGSLSAQLIVKDQEGVSVDVSQPVNSLGWEFEITDVKKVGIDESDLKKGVVAKWRLVTRLTNRTGEKKAMARIKLYTGSLSGLMNKWVTFPGSRKPEIEEGDFILLGHGEHHEDNHWLYVIKDSSGSGARFMLGGKLIGECGDLASEWSSENDVEKHRYITGRSFKIRMCLFSGEKLHESIATDSPLRKAQFWNGSAISNEVEVHF